MIAHQESMIAHPESSHKFPQSATLSTSNSRSKLLPIDHDGPRQRVSLRAICGRLMRPKLGLGWRRGLNLDDEIGSGFKLCGRVAYEVQYAAFDLRGGSVLLWRFRFHRTHRRFAYLLLESIMQDIFADDFSDVLG